MNGRPQWLGGVAGLVLKLSAELQFSMLFGRPCAYRWWLCARFVFKPMVQHWRCECGWQGCTCYSRMGMWPFWSVVLMAVMRRQLLAHGCGCTWCVVLRASAFWKGERRGEPPLQAEMVQEMTNKFKSTTNKKMAYANKNLSLIWK
jgi:hypothetical protein